MQFGAIEALLRLISLQNKVSWLQLFVKTCSIIMAAAQIKYTKIYNKCVQSTVLSFLVPCNWACIEIHCEVKNIVYTFLVHNIV